MAGSSIGAGQISGHKKLKTLKNRRSECRSEAMNFEHSERYVVIRLIRVCGQQIDLPTCKNTREISAGYFRDVLDPRLDGSPQSSATAVVRPGKSSS